MKKITLCMAFLLSWVMTIGAFGQASEAADGSVIAKQGLMNMSRSAPNTGTHYTPNPLAPSLIYDNGPMINIPGSPAFSRLETTLGMGTLGFGAQQNSNNRMADEFTLTGDFDITELHFYSYQTGSTTTSTITGVSLRVWDGVPGLAGSNIVWGDAVTNVMTSTTWSSIYRDSETSPGATNRAIFDSTVEPVGLTLTAGTYWLDWSFTGSLSSGPWQPPVTISGQTTTGNGLQSQAGGPYNPAIDTVSLTQQGLPFLVYGSPVTTGGGGIGECATDTPKAFDPPYTITSIINITDIGIIGTGSGEYNFDDINFNAQDGWVSDIVFSLESPNGTTIMLSNRKGGGSGLATARTLTFTDSSINDINGWNGGAPLADYQAQGGLLNTIFAGEPVNGNWILHVVDAVQIPDGGMLNSFCINMSESIVVVGNPPVIVCPADITANNNPGLCSAIVNFSDAVAIDLEDGVIPTTQTGGPASGSAFPVGVTTVEFSATDSDGNTVTCEFEVTVLDNEKPLAVCKNVTIDLDASGTYTLTPAEIDNGSSDNCGIATYQLGTAGAASGSLTTTFAGGNALAGSMFDLEAINNLTIDSFDVNMATGETGNIEVYFKTGTWVGSESNPAAWSLVGTAPNITSAGVGLPTPLNLNLGINVTAGARVAFYVTRTTGSLTYTNGTTVGALFASDSNLQMFEGAGKGYPFGSTFQPRNFNGNIVYSTDGVIVPFSGALDCSNIGTNDIYLLLTDNSGNTSSCLATVTVRDVTAPEVVCVGGFGIFSEYEDFEGASIPTGWTTVIESGAHDWTFGSGAMPGGPDFPTNAAIFDDDAAGSGGGANKVRLVSPAYDLVGATNTELSFDYSLQDFAGSGTFEAEVWDGTAWQRILFVDADQDPINSGIIDVSTYLNAAFKVRFTYDDENDWAWGAGVDNFLLEYEKAGGGGLDVYLDANGNATISPNDLVISVTEACSYTISAAGTGGGVAGSLTTLFASGNGGSTGGAVYFDITVGPADIEITEIDINTDDSGTFTMDVYTIAGTSVGNETNQAAWTMSSTAAGTSAGNDNPSNAVLASPITLTANTTYGMALVLDATHGHRYTNGDGSNENYSNADMSMALGAASNVPFTAGIFSPRIFNGTIHYIGGAASGLDFTCADLGENIIEVTVTDSSGNTATCMAIVNVYDITAPIIICAGTPGPNSEVEDFEGNTIPSGWTSVIQTGSRDWTFGTGAMPTGGSFPSKAAIFNDDAAGSGEVNKATLISPVYNITGSTTTSISFDYAFQEYLGDGKLTVEAYDGTAWQQVFYVDTNTNPTNTGSLDMAAFVNANFQVRFVYDDEGGWSWGAGIDNFTLNYDVAVATPVDIELGPNGTTTIDPYSLIRSIDEACGISSIAIDVPIVTCADIGAPINVTIFVSDTSGNIASCTTQINVVDRLAPVITCPANQTQDPGVGNLYYIVPDYFATGEATAIDNCTSPVTITSQSPAAGTPLSDGTYTITLTAEDEYGNVSTCTFVLKVESVLGIAENDLEKGVMLYPNPASSIVNLVNKTNLSLDKMVIFDINGKMINQIDLRSMQSEKSVDVSALASGVYMVQIIGENASTVKRLIIE